MTAPKQLPPPLRQLLELLWEQYPGYVSIEEIPTHLKEAVSWLEKGLPQREWVSCCSVMLLPKSRAPSAAAAKAAAKSKKGATAEADATGFTEAVVESVPCCITTPRLRLTGDGFDALKQDRLWDTAEVPKGNGRRRRQGQSRGRKPNADAQAKRRARREREAADRRLWEAWNGGQGQYHTIEGLAQEKGIEDVQEVRRALDRHRKRLKRTGERQPDKRKK